ncbi:hypothetical protein [Desulfobulbus oralis]|uniref:hypothetical protein n=1 Tax=Desulfobulbus oralis TaxID=1986146 RepID=UPI0011B0860A|nr:hypothetical protein [Desulfobulbus oralis]
MNFIVFLWFHRLLPKGLWMKVHKIVSSGGPAQRQARWQAAWAEDFGVARSGADVVTGAAGILVQAWATRSVAPVIRLFMVFVKACGQGAA